MKQQIVFLPSFIMTIRQITRAARALDLVHCCDCMNISVWRVTSSVPRGHWATGSWGRHRAISSSTGSFSGQKRIVENLWREFFTDPTRWCDYRLGKLNARYPDFKHKKTHKALWLDGKLNPPWVQAELAAMAPGTLPQSNPFPWNRRLVRHTKAAQYQKTMAIFQQMQDEGVELNEFTFVPVLNACASLRALEEGRRIHTQIIQSCCETDMYVASSLVDMYARCGSIEDARRVFDNMPTRNVVSWNIIIMGHVRCGQAGKALELYRKMRMEDIDPDPQTFVGLLNACASVAAVEEGRCLHEQVMERGYESDVFVASSLVDMYAKCGRMEDALTVFQMMPKRDVVGWTAMILGYVRCGQGQKALELSQQMLQEGVEPDCLTYVGFLNACGSVKALEEGRLIHKQIIQRGYESDAFVGSTLVNMYAKCGSIDEALKVFYTMPKRDVVAWTAMIVGYAKCGEGKKALELSKLMHEEDIEPNPVTFVGMLNACAAVGSIEDGRLAHKKILEMGYESDVSVGNSLIDMYAKCGSIDEAFKVFNNMPIRDVVAWSAMILGYVKCGQGQKALDAYHQMQREGVEPTPVTLVGVINACAAVEGLEVGRCVHDQIVQKGFESNTFVGNSLVDMYAKCGSLEDAWKVFNNMSTRDVVAWSSMLLGYVKCGQGQKALELSSQMQGEGVEPNLVTFIGLLNACASLGVLEEGQRIHQWIMKNGFEADVFVNNSLIDMYAKCGSVEDAWRVFKNMSTHDVSSWTAMIGGYVTCGQGHNAIELFHLMCGGGMEPSSLSIVGALNACASVAALEEGRLVHRQILQRGFESDYHVGSGLVDMYSKCGAIDDALRVFNKMSRPDVVAWTAIIAGYAMHGHAKEALGHFERMHEEGVEPDEVTFVSILSACSHSGLANEGLHYFESMSAVYDISPKVEHYGCVVDLLGRTGRLHEAQDTINSLFCKPNATLWMSLLGACNVHGNLEIGEPVARRVLEVDPKSASAHVLLSNINLAVGKWDISATREVVKGR